jgi:hypothetical protein
MEHQLKLFQDMVLDNDILYIVGNGFDLAHGIKSSYGNFKEWLVLNKYNLVEMMNVFFSNQRDVWSGIEQAMGEYDEESILDYCRPDEEFDYNHSLSASARVEDSPATTFQPILEEFREAFQDWVNSIEISGIEKIYNLNPCSRFLSFNYTDTLETEYGIKQNQVTHIHGSRLDNDEYIIGHNNYRDPSSVWAKDDLIFNIQAHENIVTWMNEFTKHFSRNIANHSSFFNSLYDIKHIIVIGHSLSKVDWPYFEEIIKITGQDIPWTVYCHNIDDRINTDYFKDSFRLSSVTIKDNQG